MAYQEDDGSRPKYTGDWKCSQCNAKIDSLPFEPGPGRESTLLCRDCYRAGKPSGQRSRGASGARYTGDWACSKCNAKIDSLPFEPDPSRIGQLLCRDCHRERMQSFRR